MQVLDFRPPEVTIKFSKGSDFNPTFFYFGKNNEIVDMTGYTAHFQARATINSDVLPGFDLTTENGGLSIVTADAETPKGIVKNAQGVRLNVPAHVVKTMNVRTAVFGLEITSPSGITTDLVKGVLEPQQEIVR